MIQSHPFRVSLALLTALALTIGCSAGSPDPGVVGAAHGAADSGITDHPPPPPPPPVVECTYTQGWYKNHPEEWSASLTIAGETYSQEELLALLWAPPRGGDASLILAHQLITALLNGGATDPAIAGVIADAMAWMAANADADGRLPYGRATRAAHGEASALADLLAAYNEGDVGPGHCDD
ncbi:MAG: hypothetical protein M3Y87_08455 [Myxococcota bacterium]|nr:hypothetical protein [Myxococcota bacterium]